MLKGILYILIGSLVFIAFLLLGIAQILKSTEIYRISMQHLEQNPEILKRLGTPIKSSFWVNGRTRSWNNYTFARYSFKISGPKGSGKILFTAEKRDGHWSYQNFDCLMEEKGESFSLLDIK